MSILKQPDERAFDEITSATVELIERLDMLLSLHEDDDPFRRLMLEHRSALDSALDVLCLRLQEAGYVPSSGNIELAELGAVAAKARAAVSTEPEAAIMARSLCKDLENLEQVISRATDELGNTHPASQDIAGLHSRVDETRETLRRFLSAQSANN